MICIHSFVLLPILQERHVIWSTALSFRVPSFGKLPRRMQQEAFITLEAALSIPLTLGLSATVASPIFAAFLDSL